MDLTWLYTTEGAAAANVNRAQARWIEKGFCEVDAGCRCFGYRGDEVGNCLDDGPGGWLRYGSSFSRLLQWIHLACILPQSAHEWNI